jgi:hypothetical protein
MRGRDLPPQRRGSHLATLGTVRSDRQRREMSAQVWPPTPSIASGLPPIGALKALFRRRAVPVVVGQFLAQTVHFGQCSPPV